MQAFVVSPSPPQSLHTETSQSKSTGDDSNFAPALAHAVSQKNTAKSETKDPVNSDKSTNKNDVLKTKPEVDSPADDDVNGDTSEMDSLSSTEPSHLPLASAQLKSASLDEQKKTSSGKIILGYKGLIRNFEGKIMGEAQNSAAENSAADKKNIANNESAKIASILANEGKMWQRSSNAEHSADKVNIQLQAGSSLNTSKGLQIGSLEVPGSSSATNSMKFSFFNSQDSIALKTDKGHEPFSMSQNSIDLLNYTSKNSKELARQMVSVQEGAPGNKSTGVAGADNFNESPKPLLSTENIIAKLIGLPVEIENGPSLRNNNNQALRHDINNQFIAAKIDKSNENGSQQNNNQQLGTNQGSAQQAQLSAMSEKSGESTTDTNFNNSISQFSTAKVSQQIIDTTKPAIVPFTAQVFEDDIIHQVIQKFRITNQLQDSKLVMKLHPAELGELKIDIQLKNGSINANIVAQSQHVQELLEKNMPKLRSLMTQHGITVENITVTFESAIVPDYNLFHDNLAKEGGSALRKKATTSGNTFELNTDDAEEHLDPAEPGVNVKV